MIKRNYIIQAMEVFPTCIRQSGIGFATLISQTISIGGPYVIYLGVTDLKLPYMVMFLICLTGSICVSLIPETLGCKLPETIAAAQEFGRKDKYFSFLPHGYSKVRTNENGETLVDWNDVMDDVFDGPVKESDINPDLVRNLLSSHYEKLKETHIDHA